MTVPRRRRSSKTAIEKLESRIAPAVFVLAASGGDAALRTAIHTADTNADASNTIELGAGNFLLNNTSLGSLLIQNSTTFNKALIIVGQGTHEDRTIEPSTTVTWSSRILEIDRIEDHG